MTLTREVHHVTGDAWHALRVKDITSTDCAALFGISPWLTQFELWHRKKNANIVTLEENERMKWGQRLQDSIAKGVCEDNGWTTYRLKDEYISIPELRIGSSFDYEINGGQMLMEVKNVGVDAYSRGWIVDGDHVEAPPYIELQVQHELFVDGQASCNKLAALVGGNKVYVLHRERDEVVIQAIQEKCAAFWKTVDANTPPSPDFIRDAGFISRLYRYAEPGKVITMDERMFGLCAEYKSFKDTAKIAEDQAKAAKAELLTLIGDAEKVIGDRFTISAGLIGPKHVEYDAAGYRDFRIMTKKFKGEK